MDREEIQAQASKFLWFHNYELIPGVMTNGAKPIKEEELAVLFQIPQDLRGKRVLDIGCADGYYTFLAEERGASVVAIDALPSQGFFLAHQVRGSKAEFHQMDIYDLQLDTFGAFDVVFFMGVYYHLKNPILALERVASVARELVIIESHIMNHQTGSTAEGLSRFYEHDELAPGDPTNWWAPDVSCLLQTVRAAGFPRAELITCYNQTRAVVHAYKGPRTAAKMLTEDIVCVIYTPLANAEVQGEVQISGMAFSKLEPEGGIERILVYLDKLDDPACELGEAKYGIWLASMAARSGDKYGPVGFEFTWNTAGVSPGQHMLYILTEGQRGWHYTARPIMVTNSVSGKSFATNLQQSRWVKPNKAAASNTSFSGQTATKISSSTIGPTRISETINRWWRKGQAIFSCAYILSLDQKARQDKQVFIERAYRLALKRSADEYGLSSFSNLLDHGVPRWVIFEILFSTDEYYWRKRDSSPGDILHALRCKLVQQLPAAETIVDLGGAAGPAIEGALLWMGYPHQPREITIIDLPPDVRMFADGFTYKDKESTEWLIFGPTRVRYLHQSMTDLSGIGDESIDLVWSGESIEHITLAEAGQMFQEVWRVLKPGGYFCLDTPNRQITQIQCPDQLIHPEHKLEYTVSQLTSYLAEAGFEISRVSGLAPMPKVAQSGIFSWFELAKNAHFSDDAEICYLFYVQCRKPDLSLANFRETTV